MSDELKIIKNNSQIRLPSDSSLEIRRFEQSMMAFLEHNGLPTGSVLVPVPQRIAVLRNIPDAIMHLNEEQRSQSLYISKFIAAVASGLFDAALNYLWDETINELRRRVAQYDLSYFYDNAPESVIIN